MIDEEFIAEVQEVCFQLYDLYEDINETAPPEIYGAVLGLHERLGTALAQLKLRLED